MPILRDDRSAGVELNPFCFRLVEAGWLCPTAGCFQYTVEDWARSDNERNVTQTRRANVCQISSQNDLIRAILGKRPAL